MEVESVTSITTTQPFTMTLQGYVDRRVLLILQDGRAIVASISIQHEMQSVHLFIRVC